MSKSVFERMSSKIITYQSYKNFMDEKFQEAIRSDSSDNGGGNLTSLQYLIAKRLDQLAPMKKIILHGINKPHLTSQLKMLPLKDLDQKRDILNPPPPPPKKNRLKRWYL